MLAATAYSMWDDMLDRLKVIFDGDNKLIYVSPQYSTVAIKIDVYSAFKRWFQRRQNSEYLPALRAIGGDPVGTSGQYAGDIYFLINGWRFVIDHQVSITGILYSDNYSSPYVITSGGGVIANVSNLAFSYNTVGTIVPTAAEISSQVWGVSAGSLTDVTTIGGQITTTKTNVDTIKVTTNNILAVSV